MRYRFIGDPAERAEGREITPGPWLDMPEDASLAGKIMGNGHYEVEGVAPAKPKPVRRKVEPKAIKIETDGWDDDEDGAP